MQIISHNKVSRFHQDSRMRSAPGDSAPPESQKKVGKVAKLKLLIDRCRNTALIGLEYIVELIFDNFIGPAYYCVQCGDHSSSSTLAIDHVKSYNHRLKYLQLHYPSLLGNIKPYLSESNAEKLLATVVDKICMAIEEVYGRLTPTVYEHAEFVKNRNELIHKIKDGRHLDEAIGSVVEYTIDLKEIQKAFNDNSRQARTPELKERSLSPITSRLKQLRYNASKLNKVNLPSDDKQSTKSHRNPSREREQNKGSTSSSNTKGNVSECQSKVVEPPKFSTLEDWRKDVQGDLSKSEQYSILIRTIVSAMEEELEKYKKNPHSHPQYPSEWDKFWEKRSTELEAAGQDPYRHDFTSEWSVYFMKRIHELHEADIKRKKLDVRKILGILPIVTVTSSSATATKKPKYQATESSSTDRRPTGSSIPINPESSHETKSRSQVEKPPVPVGTKASGKRKLEAIGDVVEIINLDDDDETLTVISVLRLLTAFEDMLGSLGPKVVDLLSKAVALEKVRPNLSDDLLMNSDNSILLDTVKEKLKGLIIAGMVQSKQEQAIRKAIRNVGDIVRLIDSKPKDQPKEHSTNTPAQRHDTDEDSRPVQYQLNHIPGSTNPLPKSTKRSTSKTERHADVLKQLATSFTLQERYISSQHLEELAVVYIANQTSSDTPYLFGLEMGKRLDQMANEQKAASVTTVSNKQKSYLLELPQNRCNDPLTMSSYGNTSNDQQHRFIGDTSFQQQLQPQVETVRDHVDWMSSSTYGFGDIDNQEMQNNTQQCTSMSSNNERWVNPQVPYGSSIQQSYQQSISQYSNVSYGYDQMKGPQPWGSGVSQMSQSQYHDNLQYWQGQQHYQHHPNVYGQRPNINMEHQIQYRTQNPMSHFNNQMHQNLSPGLNQAHQWWPRAAGK